MPERRVDFIIAFDASGDGENNWVNGTTFARTLVAAEKLGLAFPELPDATTFVNLELNKYPVGSIHSLSLRLLHEGFAMRCESLALILTQP